MNRYRIEDINSSARHDPVGFVRQSSKNYKNQVEKAADFILDNKKRIVMLAGPSSSGKTTTASFIEKALAKKGVSAKTVSLDDFYLPSLELYPRNADGSYDFESVESLDLPLIKECFTSLLESGEYEMPTYDFVNHCRSSVTKHIDISDGSIVIVEGIHGLNPEMSSGMDSSALAKIYVSVSSRVYDDNGAVMLTKRMLRFERRLVRDFLFRGTSAEETFDIWPDVLSGENKNIFPFRANADIKLDSFHPCAPGLLSSKALALLDDVKGTKYEEQAQQLRQTLEHFEPIDASCLKNGSLLCEFLGNQEE